MGSVTDAFATHPNKHTPIAETSTELDDINRKRFMESLPRITHSLVRILPEHGSCAIYRTN